MDLKNFKQAIQQLSEEKGISPEKVMETIELAIAAAYKKDYGKKGQIVKAKFDPATEKLAFTQIKIVVDETMIKSEEEIKDEEEERARKLAESAGERPVSEIAEEEPRKRGRDFDLEEAELPEGEKKVRFNPEKHLMIEEAKKIKPDVQINDELEFPLEPHSDFGRIASQTAKQVIIQRIREAEREAVFEEYKNKEGELISGIVQRIEGRNVYVDLGRGVGVLPPEEQIPGERYRLGERIKAVIALVEANPKGPGIFLSRSHPRLIKKLFELEVPEIASGTVEIKAIARESGSRTKVAVESKEENIDPVGSLVGQKGVRVTTVINEVSGEKIDIIEWSEEPTKFVANSLSPARVLDVQVGTRGREAHVIVAEDQLSLAIGKGGQNVRLAAKLTGWRIDIRSPQSKEAVAASSSGEETAIVPPPGQETVKEDKKSEETPGKKTKRSKIKTEVKEDAVAEEEATDGGSIEEKTKKTAKTSKKKKE